MRWTAAAPCGWPGAVLMPDLATLAGLARALLPADVAVAAADPGVLYPLLPGEALPNAVPPRLREFSAGRHAARLAMGDPHQPIPQGPDRAPVWPKGLSGSITHSRNACLAAVTRARHIGLDLEEDEGLAGELWDTVLLPGEQVWAQSQPDPGLASKLIFSAKEAAYKAQYTVSRRLFGFDTLSLQINETGFFATFLRDIGPFNKGLTLNGRFAFVEGHILTAVAL